MDIEKLFSWYWNFTLKY